MVDPRFDCGQLRIHRFALSDILQLQLARFTIGSLAQVFELFGFEFAHYAGLDVEHQRAVTHASNLLNVMADLFEHLAQLTVAAFNQDDFVPGVIPLADLANLGSRSLYPAGAWFAPLNAHTRTQPIQIFLTGLAADLDEVGLLHSRCGAGELVCQVAVVRYQQQPFAQVVQTADGVESLAQLCEKLHHSWPSFWIAHRGYEAPGLVEHEVAQAFRALQQFAIDADVVAGSIGLSAKLGDDFAVHLDAAFDDQVLGGAAAGDSGLSEDLLQALELAW